MKTEVIIDLSVIAYLSLCSLEASADKGGAWVTDSAELELQRRTAMQVLTYKHQFDADAVYLALDKKKNGFYWREDVLRVWNEQNITYHRGVDKDGEVYFFQERNALMYHADGSKVTKKWLKSEKVEVKPWPFELINEELQTQFQANIVGYKGDRTRRDWGHEIDQKTFAMLIGGVADALTYLDDKVFALCDTGYEADDIAATLALRPRKTCKTILVTKDTDWEQLCLGENVSLYNLNINKETELYKGFEDLVKEEIEERLRVKILTGDTSDSIPPCLTEDNKRITPTKVDDYEPTEYTLQRNETLIRLRYDEAQVERLKANLESHTGRECTWEDLCIRDFDLKYCEDMAEVNKLFEAWGDGELFGFERGEA